MRCNTPWNHNCMPQPCIASVSKIVRDSCLRPAPHTLNLVKRDESFYFDICMFFNVQPPQPVILTDCIDPRLKLCLRPDGCPDVALLTEDGCCCNLCCNSQGKGAVLEWDGKSRLLKLIFSPCLPLCKCKFTLRLHMRLCDMRQGEAGAISNCCTLHLGCKRIESNTVHVCVPACAAHCKPCGGTCGIGSRPCCPPICPRPCRPEPPRAPLCPPSCPERCPENVLFFRKTDEEGCPLPGALFVLRDECGLIVCSAVSDPCGEVVFEDISPGCFLLEEQSAPPGFRPACQTFRVIVSPHGCIRVNGMSAEEFARTCFINCAC